MGLPTTIRFRVLPDSQGVDRLAFAPVMVPGHTGMVRVTLLPQVAAASGSQRVGAEVIEVLWTDYKAAPVAIFEFEAMTLESIGV